MLINFLTTTNRLKREICCVAIMNSETSNTMREDPPKWNYFLEGKPLVIQASPLGECPRNPSVSVYQLVVLWEVAFGPSEFFFKASMHLTVLWWVICEHTCPHHTESSAVFDQKWHDPSIPPSLFTLSLPKWQFYVSPGEKKSSKESILSVQKRWNKKAAEALNGIKIDEFKNFFER